MRQTTNPTRAQSKNARVRPLDAGMAPQISAKTGARLAALFSSANQEWCMPVAVVERVLEVLGAIDLDPCSNSHDNPVIPAAQHFTREDGGLAHEWHGRVYMNPPYGLRIGAWIDKLLESYHQGSVTEAIALLPARPDTRWFDRLRGATICFIKGRLTFRGAPAARPSPRCWSTWVRMTHASRLSARIWAASGARMHRAKAWRSPWRW